MSVKKYLTLNGLTYFLNKIKTYLTSSTYLNSIGISNSDIDDIADDAGYSSGSLPASEDIFITGDIIPNTDNSVDLGASSKNIKMIYTKGITINGTQFLPSDYIPKTGSNQISGSLIPSTNGTVNLGGSSYQWNNLYAKNYYYKGVAWGLDKANVWTAHQKIAGSNLRGVVSIYNQSYTKGSASSSTDLSIGTIFMGNGGQEGLANSLGFISTDLASNGDITQLSLSAIENTASSGTRTNVVLLYDKNDAENPRKVIIQGSIFPHADATYSLGTTNRKWKSFNGINPGALSLPSTYVNVDTTNWVLDGSQPNHFVPTSDGWFGIQCIDTVYDQTHYVFIGRTGYGSAYYQQNAMSPVSALWDSKYHACVFIPVIKNINYDIRCICSNITATFYPCQGNV